MPVCPRVNEVNTPMLRTGFVKRGFDPDTAVAELGKTVPLGRIAEPEDIADAVLRIAPGRFVTQRMIDLPYNGLNEPAPSEAPVAQAPAAVEAAPVAFEGKAIPVTVSIGLATAFSTDDIDALLAESDAALYRAKNTGRNRVVYGGSPVPAA